MKLLILFFLGIFFINHTQAQYGGGIGRGDFLSIRYNQALDGTDLTAISSGGNGRGDNNATKYSQHLSGVDLAILYRGGIGRGDVHNEVHSGFADCAIVFYWNGSFSDAWENPLNWNCNAIPGIASNVIIPSGVPRFPKVSLSTEIKSLNLGMGTTVIVNPGVQLKLNGQ